MDGPALFQATSSTEGRERGSNPHAKVPIAEERTGKEIATALLQLFRLSLPLHAIELYPGRPSPLSAEQIHATGLAQLSATYTAIAYSFVAKTGFEPVTSRL